MEQILTKYKYSVVYKNINDMSTCEYIFTTSYECALKLVDYFISMDPDIEYTQLSHNTTSSCKYYCSNTHDHEVYITDHIKPTDIFKSVAFNKIQQAFIYFQCTQFLDFIGTISLSFMLNVVEYNNYKYTLGQTNLYADTLDDLLTLYVENLDKYLETSCNALYSFVVIISNNSVVKSVVIKNSEDFLVKSR
jgi:hypothetical protein